MNIILTGSIGTIGKPLTEELVRKGHTVTVITSKPGRQAAIEALGATAAIGSFFDADFLTKTFSGADLVYLMEAWEGIGSVFDKDVDFVAAFEQIGNNYKQAVAASGVKRVVHLSSIGAHTDQGTGSLRLHYNVENILRQLPEDVSIKFIRPVGFYTNLYRYLDSIKTHHTIRQSYGGDQKEPWVSPLDIAATISEEMDKPFDGREVHYVVSDEVSPNEIARTLGEAIGLPDLTWTVIPDEEMLAGMRAAGMNEWIAEGFVAMQAAQRSGTLYEDFYRHKPTFGKTKLSTFAREFAQVYHQQNNKTMKTALITGANKGIGFETARQLLQNGYYVYLGSRSLENGQAAADMLKAEGLENAEAVPLDVTSSESVAAARQTIGRNTDTLDVLINNAGIHGGMPQSSLEASVDQFRQVFETNLYGVARVTQAFIDLMRKAPEPRIVNVSSSGCSLTLQSDPTWTYYSHKAAVYPSSKAALNMYTIDLAYQLKETAFRVNAVCPGFVATEFNDHRGTGTVQEGGARIAKYAMIGPDGPTGKFIAEEYNPETGETPW